MGSICCTSRKTELLPEGTSINGTNDHTFNDVDYTTEAITEEKLKCMYSNANKEENLDIMCKLVDNTSKIEIAQTDLSFNWITKPETLGDIAIIQIYTIIQQRVKVFSYEEPKLIGNESIVSSFQNKIQDTIQSFERLHFIEKMVELLESSSYTKMDTSILILCSISTCQPLVKLLMTKVFLTYMVKHLRRLKKLQYVNTKEHFIVTLQILKRIYVKDIKLRKIFVELGGVYMIYEFLACGDVDIMLEALYNIEDLIYRDEENNYQSISKLVIQEMREILIKLNINKVLYDLYTACRKNQLKYGVIIDDIKRVISAFADYGGVDTNI